MSDKQTDRPTDRPTERPPTYRVKTNTSKSQFCMFQRIELSQCLPTNGCGLKTDTPPQNLQFDRSRREFRPTSGKCQNLPTL